MTWEMFMDRVSSDLHDRNKANAKKIRNLEKITFLFLCYLMQLVRV